MTISKTRKQMRQTNVRLKADVVDRLNAFCRLHPLQPRRDAIIDVALEEYLSREEANLDPARAQKPAARPARSMSSPSVPVPEASS